MAQLQLIDPLITCPYDPAHQILKSRMQFHLVKCEKNHSSSEKDVCPYNATHRIALPERQHHIANCPDRRVVEGHMFQISDELAGGSAIQAYQQPQLPPNEENWDDELVQSSYEPQQHSTSRGVLRNLQGATKSQRKQFRMDERRRLASLAAFEKSARDSPAVPPRVEDVKPLRLPRSQSASLPAGSKLGMGRGRAVGSDSLARQASVDDDDCLVLPCAGRGRGKPL